MPERIAINLFTALFIATVSPLSPAVAQAPGVEAGNQLRAADSYKVEFAVNEIENGKKINSRSYMMLLRAERPEPLPKWTDRQHLRVGSRVPYATAGDSFQYQDVGMNIDCRLMPFGNGNVAIDANLEYSSLQGGPGSNPQHPVFRQVRSGGETLVAPDKPTVIAEMDDVASTHRYVFEAKVTKIIP